MVNVVTWLDILTLILKQFRLWSHWLHTSTLYNKSNVIIHNKKPAMYHTSPLLNVSQKKIIYDGSIVGESGSRLMISSGVCGVGTCVHCIFKPKKSASWVQSCWEISLYLCLIESICLQQFVPLVDVTTYETGPLLPMTVAALHFGGLPVKFSTKTLFPTRKVLSCFFESWSFLFYLLVFHFLWYIRI